MRLPEELRVDLNPSLRDVRDVAEFDAVVHMLSCRVSEVYQLVLFWGELRLS
jgi:hypothetical protein